MINQATFPLLLALSPAFQADPSAALERRLRRSMLRREPVTAGSLAEPYETGSSASPLRLLLAAEGLEVSVTTASPRILRELELLVELDRRHSVAVRIVVPVSRTPDAAARLEAARRIAAEGITTRLVLAPAPGARAADVRTLLAEAREDGIFDVELDLEREPLGERKRLRAAFWSLRLEHGFPRDIPGRG
jgi:DNA repair photolyase